MTTGDPDPAAARPASPPWHHVREIRLGEYTFDVAESGPADGPPVLLLHGFPESFDCWRTVAPVLAAAGLHVIAPDQRGYSPGARPTAVSAYSTANLVTDAAGILDAFGEHSAHVVGHDWGASVAWTLAARSPGRVRTLTAVSVPHLAAFANAVRSDDDQKRRSQYMRRFQEDPAQAAEALLADDGARFRAAFEQVVPEDLVDAHWRRLGTRDALIAALNWYRAMDRGTSAIPDVTVPTTYVWGDEDVALGRAGAEACGDHVTGDYRFVTLHGTGHWIPETAGGRLAQEILRRIAG